jgi:hypothetical protein
LSKISNWNLAARGRKKKFSLLKNINYKTREVNWGFGCEVGGQINTNNYAKVKIISFTQKPLYQVTFYFIYRHHEISAHQRLPIYLISLTPKYIFIILSYKSYVFINRLFLNVRTKAPATTNFQWDRQIWTLIKTLSDLYRSRFIGGATITLFCSQWIHQIYSIIYN